MVGLFFLLYFPCVRGIFFLEFFSNFIDELWNEVSLIHCFFRGGQEQNERAKKESILGSKCKLIPLYL